MPTERQNAYATVGVQFSKLLQLLIKKPAQLRECTLGEFLLLKDTLERILEALIGKPFEDSFDLFAELLLITAIEMGPNTVEISL